MTARELLSLLRGRGVSLWLEGESLRYSAPKGAFTSELRAQVAERKAEIIEFLRRAASAESNATGAPIKRASRAGALPLSFAQQRLWFLDQLAPGNPFYNISLNVPLRFPVSVTVLERCLDELVRRHESLRTSFAVRDGQPVQVIAERVSVSLPVVDLTTLPPHEAEEEAHRRAEEEARRPFDLTRVPLMRATLLKLRATDFRLLLTMHHIVSDGWSMGIFFRELSTLYTAFLAGRPSPLAELPIQYADFAVWQRDWLKGEALAAQLDYWRRQLADLPALLLPTDRTRPAIQMFRGGYHPVQLSKTLTERLNELSRAEGVTLFMTLLTAYQAMLQRYTGQEDIVVGAPIAGRNRAEIENLIGFFVNSLVLRTDLTGDPTVREMLRRTQEVTLGAYAHQDLPFEMLVEELQPERDLSRNPLFQVTFQLFNAPTVEQQQQAGASEVARVVRRGTAIFDLVFTLTESPHGLAGGFEYDSDLFDAATIERMAEHFQTLLAAFVARPDTRLSELPLLSEAERRRMLVEWNETRVSFPRGLCLHQLFEAQVERTPDAVAVEFRDERVSYRELNARANRLAHRLRALGVGPDVLVGLCVEQSIEMVSALLGVLKAGGAYVPLDPAYPRDRLRFMLEDARVRVLLTQREVADALPAHDAEVIYLDQQDEASENACEENPRSGVGEQHIAYMLYTSGSTGRPRGVLIPHSAICNHMLWMLQTFPLDADDRVIQRTPFSFDASVWEFYAPLLSGARLVMYRPGRHLDVTDLVAHLAERRITTLQLVPSLLRLLLEDPEFDACQSLRRVFCGGEALPAELQERFHARFDASLCNLYGPTEACIDATFYKCARDDEQQSASTSSVPIGAPVANMRAYVLDARMSPVPIGVAGELYLGGRGLARGYYNRPDTTAEKFVPDPFADEPGERLYRTGDLVRYRPDANLEFLGRVDYQVKLRGYRIELGEIESVLARHASVKEAVVLAREDAPGERKLVAYVVQNQEAATDGDAGEQLGDEQVGQWQKVYDEIIYQDLAPRAPGEAAQNFVGWNSSYTGQPIPLEEMREWAESTVERILELRPKRVLEIGCGTGLMLFRVAPHCEEYWGADFSRSVIEYLRMQVESAREQLPTVNLLCRTADDLADLEPRSFDTVILNSVVQYFPDIDYLRRVIASASNAVRPGGAIFVGDVRSLPLLEAFHTSVELSQAPDSLTAERLRQRVHKRLSEEQELVIDPAFFYALKEHLPRIGRVVVRPKRGRAANELTLFRYDVTLYVEPADSGATDERDGLELDWKKDALTLERLRGLLCEERPRRVVVRRVPNARVSAELAAVSALEEGDGASPVGALQEIVRASRNGAVEPEAVWELSRLLPYEIDVQWSGANRDGSFQVICERRTQEEASTPVARALTPPPDAPARVKSWKHYANNPLQGLFTRRLVPELRDALQEQLPEHMMPSAFVLLDALPLTPNGKLDRRALPPPGTARPELREEYVAPATPTEELLADIWKQVLGIERVGTHDNFFALGGDSILSIQIIARANQAGLRLTPQHLFQNQTIAALALVAEDDALHTDEQQSVTGFVPLTPTQSLLLEDEDGRDPQRLTRTLRFNVAPDLDAQVLHEAVRRLVLYHDALRLRFERDGEGWQQFNAPPVEDVPFESIDLSALEAAAQCEAFETHAAALRGALSLSDGLMLRAALLLLGGGRRELLVVVHRLAADAASCRILVEELQSLCEQLVRGETVRPSAKAASFKHWAQRLDAYAQSPQLKAEAEYWHALGGANVKRLPVDSPSGNNARSLLRTLTKTFEPEETSDLLRDVHEAYRAGAHEALLTALVQAFERWTGAQTLLVDIEGDGRDAAYEHLDLARTVGCFETIFPVLLRLDGAGHAGEALKSVKEQLRRVPNGGLGYGLLRRASGEAQPSETLRAEVCFRYLGQFERRETDALSVVSIVDAPAREARGHLLDVSSLIVGGRLSLTWTYSENLHRRSTVERLAHLHADALRALIAHCKSPEAGGFTPSDFSGARLSQKDLDKLLSRIKR
ncbi:MAG TPA: amino acid adenylation domain-containing protein [Pyrinomonadaceae bacterium]|nr:amino acid adenylation domain-containing protein [Pyrinomonadaceae bacterium]